MELPDRIGVMLLDGCPLFPQALVPLFIFEPRYRCLLADALDGHRMMCLAMRRPGSSVERPCELAGIGLIRVSVRHPNGTSNLLLQGVSRVRLGRAVRTKPYRVHRIEPVPDEVSDSLVTDALMSRVLELVEARLSLGVSIPLDAVIRLAGCPAPEEPVSVADCMEALRRVRDPGILADLAATLLLPDAAMRQVVLQSPDVEERLRHLVHFLLAEVARLQQKPTSP